MAVENYHLKWDSHVSFLNTSVATLYKNEKFADVVLYSSSTCSGGSSSHGSNAIENAIPTVGIPAHKFILSSCSQFFATLFDNTPIPSSSGVLYVVLPPELSHRAIQILVQYIYTGEATVSNDILTEVLRGGEILKVRGLCRSASQREAGNNASCNNSIHFGTNGTRPHNLFPPTVIHGTSAATAASLTTDPYAGNKCNAQSHNGNCSARYGIEPVTHSQSSIQSQIRGLGASCMPKDSPVIVKSPKITSIGQLPSNREAKQHVGVGCGGGGGSGGGGGITVNKEVAIDPDDNCCYQASVVPSILHHEPIQLPLPQSSQPIVSMGGSSSICSDISCKNCSYNNATELEKQRHRQRHLSQSEELPHRLPGIERLERDYSDERCEFSDAQLLFNRRNRNGNDRVSNFYITDHYDPSGHTQAHLIAASKTPKQYETSAMPPTTSATVASSSLQSPPLYPHNFLTIKQEPIDWTEPQATPAENSEDMIDRSSLVTPPQAQDEPSPKQPLDFKIPLGNSATIKIEDGTSTQDADEEDLTGGSAIGPYNTFSRLVCDVCKKSFEEPKLWLQHLDSHTAVSAAAAAAAAATAASITALARNVTPISEASGADTLNKSYVPKKRRRASQPENNMTDHVTLSCDLCNTSFDTPAEWVRHMNNQHTEIELAMFNSKKDKEQSSTNSSSMTCSSSSRNHHHHHSQQHHHQHQHQHHQNNLQHLKQQAINKKYSNRSEMPSTHNRSDSNWHSRKANLFWERSSSKQLRSSSPTVVEHQRINLTQVSLRNIPLPLSPSPPPPPPRKHWENEDVNE